MKNVCLHYLHQTVGLTVEAAVRLLSESPLHPTLVRSFRVIPKIPAPPRKEEVEHMGEYMPRWEPFLRWETEDRLRTTPQQEDPEHGRVSFVQADDGTVEVAYLENLLDGMTGSIYSSEDQHSSPSKKGLQAGEVFIVGAPQTVGVMPSRPNIGWRVEGIEAVGVRRG